MPVLGDGGYIGDASISSRKARWIQSMAERGVTACGI